MIMLLLVGIIVMIVGKFKLTHAIQLSGTRARWYGFTLVLTSIPFTLLFGTLVVAITPESVLADPLWRRVINYATLIAYLALVALPFRERNNTGNQPEPTNVI